jgi:predicted secreted protein
MGAYVGRDVLVEFASGLETANPATLAWKTLGMMRGKELSTKWDEVDTTADASLSQTRTSLCTFKSVEFSGDGVSYDDAVHNQLEFELAFHSPSAAMGRQPKFWLRITYPNKMYQGPFTVNEFSNSTAYDAEATWSMAAKSNGAVALTPI